MDRGVWKRGVSSGLRTTWMLSKIIVPVTIVVTILKHTPVIGWIVDFFAPVMHWLELPGESAVVLGLGLILNLYAAIGAMFALPLNSYEIFVLAVMLSFAHNLFVETAVAKQSGLSAIVVCLIRIGTAFLSAALISLFAPDEAIRTSAAAGRVSFDPYFWNMEWQVFLVELLGKAWTAVWQLTVVVIPLMFVIQILKEIQFLDRMAGWMHPITRLLGLPERAAIPLLAGLFFGLALGAGIILQTLKEENLSRRELYLMFIFLILCHAVVEDTLLFVPLGVNGWLLLGIRLSAAVVITSLLSRIWREQTAVRKLAISDGK